MVLVAIITTYVVTHLVRLVKLELTEWFCESRLWECLRSNAGIPVYQHKMAKHLKKAGVERGEIP